MTPRPLTGLVVLLALLAAGCPRPAPPAEPVSDFGPLTDAPWELEDADDWAEVRDQMFALPASDGRRRDLRIQLAAAQADRIGHWLDANRPSLAYEALLELIRLWSDEPALIGGELAAQQAVLTRARAVFARAGADQEVVLTLVVLGEIDPAQRDAAWAEIDEVLGFADELAKSQNGPDAIRARPIQILEPVALALPLPRVTDRYVELVAGRQGAVAGALGGEGATFELVRAHTEVLRAARALAAALARAGRAADIGAAIAPMRGIGADDELATLAVAAAAPAATARDWAKLARAFRGSDDNDDPASARAIAAAGLVRFADDATLMAAAARASMDMERVHEPIRWLEALRRGAGAKDDDVAEMLTGLYRDRLTALAFNDRPVEAQARLAELETFHQSIDKQWPGRPWPSSLAVGLATVGRGLVSQGELDAAITLLERSIKLEPDADAYEMLATIATKRERWKEARTWAERGIALPGDTGAHAYTRAKLLKLAGDAAEGLGDHQAAHQHWTTALEIWVGFGDNAQLPTALAGERLIQAGSLLWSLGEIDQGVRLVEASVDLDPDGADTHTQVVAFFIVHDEFARALDAYHRAVLADRIGDYHKVYMSLWMLAEARRREVDPDPLAVEYLEKRDGALWYDEMSRLATGRLTVGELAPRATTRARKAELAYYTAVLGLGDDGAPRPPTEVRALLEGVVATDMVLFFEYDMARHWLAQAEF